MKFNKYLLILAFITFSPKFCISQNQNKQGIATYEFQYHLTKQEIKSYKNMDNNRFRLLDKPINWVFKLKFDDSLGLSYLDSLHHKKDLLNNSFTFTVNNETRFINTNDNTFSYNYTNLDSEKIIVKGDIRPDNWKISNETKTIKGYKVVKATGYLQSSANRKNKKVTAWFAPNIPVKLGPVSFGNLPGLILELWIGDDFSYNLTDIVFKDDVQIPSLKGKYQIEEKEFKENYTITTEYRN